MISELIVEADRALSEGRLEDAEGLCRSVLKAEPANFPAQLVLGIVLSRKDRFEEAAGILADAESADPGTGKAALWLSKCFRALGKSESALDAARRAAEASPGDPAIQHQLGICYLEEGQFEEAAAHYRRLTKSDPTSAHAHHGLGLALKSLSRNSAALTSLKRATVLAPDSVPYRLTYFQALMDESDSPGAVESARALLQLAPGAESHLRLARALLTNGDVKGAEASLQQAIGSGITDGVTACATGTVLQGLGRLDEAERMYRLSTELAPDLGLAYSGLAFTRKISAQDLPLVEQMENLTSQRNQPPQNLSHLHYALGKSKEDLGEYGEAIAHYDQANNLALSARFGHRRFDREAYARGVDLSLQSSRTVRSPGSESELPIFVVGMLRSGTTLVDQILSSHPQIGSAGEQGFWLHNRDSLIEGRDIGALATKYISTLKDLGPGKHRMVDKMPDNYAILPHLHAAFPNAKIIHVIRNAADTCLSIYSTMNRLDLDWAHDKEDIGFVYRQYQRMMEAWQQLLPEGAMMEVRYEDLVAQPEDVTRQMIDFIGLPWDDACLRPELNPRSVSTPSSWQVRQPVYTTSVDRWRKFEPWIEPFASLTRT